MYSKAIRAEVSCGYSMLKGAMASVFRFQYPNDYTKPVIRVKFPGPNHLKAMELSGVSTSQRFVNLKHSKGNYFMDTDGNVVLDLNCSLALGYNHDSLIN